MENVITKKITKVELKRLQDLRNVLSERVGGKLRSFENKFMDAYISWGMAPLAKEAAKFTGYENFEAFKTAMVGKTHQETTIENSCKYDKSGIVSVNDAYYAWKKAENARYKSQIRTLTQFGFMKLAADSYKMRFDKLIDKMMEVDFTPNNIRVRDVSAKGGELELLIDEDPRFGKSDMEFHARFIWAEGEVNAPHYRFITTIRNKK